MFGKTLYRNLDQSSPHDWSWAARAAFRVVLRDRVEMMPGTYPNAAILGILGHILLIRFEKGWWDQRTQICAHVVEGVP